MLGGLLNQGVVGRGESSLLCFGLGGLVLCHGSFVVTQLVDGRVGKSMGSAYRNLFNARQCFISVRSQSF